MTEGNASCERRIAQELSRREQVFADIWRRAHDDSEQATVFRMLDPLGVEGDPVITIQFSRAHALEWLQIRLSETASDGVGCVTYHCADLTDHAERMVSESRTPALWLAATYYANLAEHLLLTARQREGS